MSFRIPHRASLHMDLMRGLAAVAVLAGHTRSGTLVDYKDVAHPSLWVKALYFLTGFAHQAVIAFFILSGFFIGLSVMRSWERWSWKDYLVARLVRLYLVLIPAQILCAAWDNAGIALFGVHAAYAGDLHGAAVGDGFTAVAGRLGWSEFAGSLLFLSNIVTPFFGSNGILWSLVCEFWYYLAFPFTFAVFARRSPLSQRALGAVMTAAILWWIGAEWAGYYLVWLTGVLVAVVLRSPWRPRLPAWLLQGAGAMAALGTLALSRFDRLGGPLVADLLVGAGFALFLFALQVEPDTGKKPLPQLYAKVAKGLAAFSFTLYAVQAPPAPFLDLLILKGGPRHQPGAFILVHDVLLIAGIMLYAWAVSRLTEAHTERVRAWVTRRLRPAVEPA